MYGIINYLWLSFRLVQALKLGCTLHGKQFEHLKTTLLYAICRQSSIGIQTLYCRESQCCYETGFQPYVINLCPHLLKFYTQV